MQWIVGKSYPGAHHFDAAVSDGLEVSWFVAARDCKRACASLFELCS